MSARLLTALVSLAAVSPLSWTTEQVADRPAAVLRVTVVDDTGAAVAGARVALAGATIALHRVTESDVRGGAVFEQVPAGTFALSAEKPGHVGRAFAIPIALADRDSFTARLELPRAGSIMGVIRDESGRPARAAVRVLRHAPASSPLRPTPIATTRTAQDGTYRFDGLLPGTYIVSARGADSEPPSTADRTSLAYIPVFFHSTTTASGATPVDVRPGEATPAIDLQLQRVGRARLEGVVLDADGQPAASRTVHLVRADDDGLDPLTVRTSRTGEFAAALVPGLYTVIADGGGTMDVVATPDALTRITVPLQRGARILGRLRFVGSTPPSLIDGALGAELVPRAGPSGRVLRVMPLRVHAETFAFVADAVPPGEYLVRLGSNLGAWVLESAAVGDRELVDDIVHVRAGETTTDLILTLAGPTELSGSVVDRQGAPVFDNRILVFAAGREYWRPGSRRVRWAQPDTKGRFVIRGLPPGQYLLAAIAGPEDDWDGALLEAAAKGAVPVALDRGKAIVQNVMIAR